MTTTSPPPPPPTQLALMLPGVEITPTGATATGPLDRTNLAAALVGMARSVSSARWIVGDLFWAMVDEDGGDTAPAARIMHGLGFEQDWLATAIDVAANVAPVVRRPDLAWGHHEAVSHLEGGDQEVWLSLAAGQSWTVVELKHALKEHASAAQGQLEGTGGDPGPVRVPKVPVGAVRSILAVDDQAWVLWQPASGQVRKYERPGGGG